jgi:hypothetical protein
MMVEDLLTWLASTRAPQDTVAAEQIGVAEWSFAVGSSMRLLEKIEKMPVKLEHLANRISQGIRTSANEVYVLDMISESSGLIRAFSKILSSEISLERDAVSRFLQGKDIKAYCIRPPKQFVINPYRIRDCRAIPVPEAEILKEWPRAMKYLAENKKYLCAREEGRFRGPHWYEYGRNQNIDLMLLPKILVPDIADRAAFAFDENGEFAFTSGYGITLRPGAKESPRFLLSLCNSSLLDWYWKKISTPLRGGFYRYFTQFVARFPIRPIDFKEPSERAEHNALVKLAERIEVAKKGDPGADISAFESEIDERVYRLYGLTKDEIKIVEEGS